MTSIDILAFIRPLHAVVQKLRRHPSAESGMAKWIRDRDLVFSYVSIDQQQVQASRRGNSFVFKQEAYNSWTPRSGGSFPLEKRTNKTYIN